MALQAASKPDNHDTSILELPFLTAGLCGTGGVIKSQYEDFVVEEVPLYQPCGEGSHAYVMIEKRGLTTSEAANRFAEALGRTARDVGFAGLKDARSVARQWFSIEHVQPERLHTLRLDNPKILRVERHRNKLKLGHLAANRFVIKIRRPDLPAEQACPVAREILSILSHRGVPNYFGPQRFGSTLGNHLLGKAVLNDQAERFVDIFLGDMAAADSSAAKRLHHGTEERRALKVLAKSNGDKKEAYRAINNNLKKFFVSAYQSYVFNRVLAARMPDIDKIMQGDMAYLHRNGACFRVEDAGAEQARCDRFEISPTGPLFGLRMTRLTGHAGEIENAILKDEGIDSDDWKGRWYSKPRGGRRPLRFQPRNWNVGTGLDDAGEYLELRFELDPGCYATTLLREVTKK
jgi:tRNA pseudouridine13 synthase